MFLAILIITSLSLQLTGTFFLATQIIPKAWPEHFKKNLQEKRQKLLKMWLIKEKQLIRLQPKLINTDVIFTILSTWGLLGVLTILFSESADSQELKKLFSEFTDSEEIKEIFNESELKGTPKTIVNFTRILKREITEARNTKLLGLFYLFLLLFSIVTLYLEYHFVELVQRITYFLIEGIIRVFSHFSNRQGEQIFALLGIFLLAVGFIFQAIVDK